MAHCFVANYIIICQAVSKAVDAKLLSVKRSNGASDHEAVTPVGG